MDAKRWPLGACVCGACWLVQLTELVPDDVLWGGDYGFFTGASPSAVDYFRHYALDLWVQHLAWRDGLLVEVACNDGTLLAELALQQEKHARALGVEPAKGPAEAARARGLDVIGLPFGRDVAQAITDAEGQASLVIANNVLAHVADLDDFVGGLALLLAADGRLVVEVQDVDRLLLGNGFDLLYHEHRTFFSVATLGQVLARHALVIERWARTPAQGGSIRATVRKSTDRTPTHLRALYPDMIDGMQARADAVRDELRLLVDAERAAGRVVVGYGAPAKATTLLHWCGLTSSEDVAAVYDLTPAKSGRFMPGTDIPIVTLGLGDEPLGAERTTALLLVHNYLPGVLRREREFVDDGGRFLVPLPVPVIL